MLDLLYENVMFRVLFNFHINKEQTQKADILLCE